MEETYNSIINSSVVNVLLGSTKVSIVGNAEKPRELREMRTVTIRLMVLIISLVSGIK
jgi:hypothetical protein